MAFKFNTTIFWKLAKMAVQPASIARGAHFFLIIPTVILFALCLTGCISTSPGLPNIYIVSLRSNAPITISNNITINLPTQIRIGYYGICAIDNDGTRCHSVPVEAIHHVNDITDKLFKNKHEPLSNSSSPVVNPNDRTLVKTAVTLQSQVFFSALPFAGVSFLLGVLLLLVLQRLTSSSSATFFRRSTYTFLFGSVALTLCAAVATAQGSAALEHFGTIFEMDEEDGIIVKRGLALQIMQWFILGLQMLFGILVPFVISSSQRDNAVAKAELERGDIGSIHSTFRGPRVRELD